MCNYQGYEFGAGAYPDSVCIDGYLYNADYCDEKGRLYINDDEEKIPCPKCNPTEHKEWLKEQEIIREETRVW